MPSARSRILAPLSLALLVAGCSCLDEIHLKPELNAADLKKATLGGAALDVVWKFKECCPTGEQQDIALAMQQRIAELFEETVAGRISLSRYNELVRAAQVAITEVILACAAQGKHTTDPQMAALTRPQALQDAWKACRKVEEELDRALRARR